MNSVIIMLHLIISVMMPIIVNTSTTLTELHLNEDGSLSCEYYGDVLHWVKTHQFDKAFELINIVDQVLLNDTKYWNNIPRTVRKLYTSKNLDSQKVFDYACNLDKCLMSHLSVHFYTAIVKFDINKDVNLTAEAYYKQANAWLSLVRLDNNLDLASTAIVNAIKLRKLEPRYWETALMIDWRKGHLQPEILIPIAQYLLQEAHENEGLRFLYPTVVDMIDYASAYVEAANVDANIRWYRAQALAQCKRFEEAIRDYQYVVTDESMTKYWEPVFELANVQSLFDGKVAEKFYKEAMCRIIDNEDKMQSKLYYDNIFQALHEYPQDTEDSAGKFWGELMTLRNCTSSGKNFYTST